MDILITILLILHVVVCLLLTVMVLMQRPKQEGLGVAFGGGMTDQIMGAQASNILQRGTVYFGIALFLITLFLSALYARRNKSSEELAEGFEGADAALHLEDENATGQGTPPTGGATPAGIAPPVPVAGIGVEGAGAGPIDGAAPSPTPAIPNSPANTPAGIPSPEPINPSGAGAETPIPTPATPSASIPTPGANLQTPGRVATPVLNVPNQADVNVETPKSGLQDAANKVSEGAAPGAEAVKEASSGLLEKAGDAAGKAVDAAGEGAEAVKEAGSSLLEKAGDAVETVVPGGE